MTHRMQLVFMALFVSQVSAWLVINPSSNWLTGRLHPAHRCLELILKERAVAAEMSSSPGRGKNSRKQIILIRHGQTYMNEYIGNGGITFGAPNFTDIFLDPEDKLKYHDSPLSEIGMEQAKNLNRTLVDLNETKTGALEKLGFPWKHSENEFTKITSSESIHLLTSIDMVVVSPLTRALETLEVALCDSVLRRGDACQSSRNVPMLAMAAAAERLYLVSDLGKPRSELLSRFPYVDFDTAFWFDTDNGIANSSTRTNADDADDQWHFSPTESMERVYEEWRPNGQGQKYACLGEPTDHFDRRMSDLYHWLESREETCIAMVCHAGVIEWMTSGEKFSNCELRIQPFDSLKPRALQTKR